MTNWNRAFVGKTQPTATDRLPQTTVHTMYPA